MAEKKLLEKLRDEYLEANGSADAATVSAFCEFAEKWLAASGPTGISYSIDGLLLLLANGDRYIFVPATETDAFGSAVSVTGMTKLNARAAPTKATDFPITGR